MLFSYEAYNKMGEKIIGSIEADTKEYVGRMLYDQNMIVSKIIPIKRTNKIRVAQEELIIFTRLLTTAVNASIPLTKALEITMEELKPKSELRVIILSILHELKVGKNLSDALQLYQNVFSELYVNMIKAGERSGKLGNSLSEVLKYLQKRYEIKKKISSSLLYPGFIMGFAVIILLFFLVFLIPQFQESYTNFGGELPDFTLTIIGITDWIKSHLLLIFFIIAGAAVAIKLSINTDKGRLVFENILYSFPIAGDIIKKDIISRFTRTLSVLLLNGITLIDSLDLTRGIVGSRSFEITIINAIKDLREGKNFSGALKENRHIPSILIQMASMGEESGRLAQLLENLSEFYEKDVDVSIEKITSLITPIIIVFIGFIIGAIVVGLFLPIFNISDMLG